MNSLDFCRGLEHTVCISCVVQQRSRVKDFCFLEIRLVKRIKGIQSLVEEICKITRSKLNCQRLQYEIHFIIMFMQN